MNIERDSRHKLVEAHVYQHRAAGQVKPRHLSNSVKPKAKSGAIREREVYERFGF